VDAVQDLWEQLVRHHAEVGDWPVRREPDSWALIRQRFLAWLADDHGLLLIARGDSDPDPAGFAFCVLDHDPPTFDLGEVVGDLHALVVDSGRRGEGIGRALIDACRAELRAIGVRHWSVGVLDGNERAHELYRREGFRPLFHILAQEL
jgi:ribosomal protein S18 acetylase RimI-like enzyme